VFAVILILSMVAARVMSGLSQRAEIPPLPRALKM
jgi:hypothetical protein